jgi:parallel beta-helix repeat protein
MHFYSSSDNNILSNNINLVEEIGITLISSMGNTILSNNITSKETSIYLYSSDDNIVASNYVSNDISLDLSSNNTILSNEISTKNRVGVSLNSSSVNIILGNNINQREIGIYLYSSGGNSIVGNGVSNNRHGIDLYFSIGNLITNNDVYSNIETGISLNSSSHNVLYHNNFIDNRNNAFDNNNNTWDDGDKGNYWSDYEERYPDAQKIWPKGIWSEPYEIPGGENKDRYPLIKPYKTREKISNPASFDSLITSSWRIPFFIVAKTPKFPVDTNNHKQGIIHIPLSTLRSHLINHFRYYFPDKMFDFVTFLHLFFKIVYLSLEGFAW